MTIVNQTSAHRPPLKYVKYTQLDSFMYERFGRTIEGPAKQRLLKVARAKYVDEIEQSHAIARAAQEELAVVVEPSTATVNIDAFQKEMNTRLLISAAAPIPYLEERRPAWSSRAHDQKVKCAPEDEVAAVSDMSWRSQPVVMPLTTEYFGRWSHDGHFESATIMADVRQDVLAAEPRIAFERQGFKQVDGEVREIEGAGHYALSLQEAGNLARALLLLIDLATGTTDEIAGS